mgnify:CR=1 FL=1
MHGKGVGQFAEVHSQRSNLQQRKPRHVPVTFGNDGFTTAQQSGLFPVFEAEQGVVTAVSKIRRRVPVVDYLQPQKRFAHLFAPQRRDDVIAQLQAQADRNIREYRLIDPVEVEGA